MTKKCGMWLSKLLFTLGLLTLTSATLNRAYAVPAKPGVITKVKQVDGTTINIKINGDEHFNWKTTEAGYPIVEKEGYFYYAKYESNGTIVNSNARVMEKGRVMTPPSGVTRQNMATIASSASSTRRAAKSAAAANTPAKAFPCNGTIKAVIILAEYTDVKFSVENPRQAFENQLNEEGYSVAGATGSARDYYSDCSGGKFDGDFDVYGPYTLPNKRSYYGGNDYGGNDKNPDQMIWDAVSLANEDGVDFSQYDIDNDGYIDNVFVYYAGHNEAEGGSSDSVWPHKWSVYSKPRFDGKTLYGYACTSELRGSSGSTIAGIATFCHEFSHVFGLADHYDTNYYTGGYSEGTGDYDIMCSGSYNNHGNTPPMFNALEMDMIGWCTPTIIDSNESITLEPIKEMKTYKVLTEEPGEYFLIENRDRGAIVWDSYIPGEGLLISHVDRSSNEMWRWDYNSPNSDPSHECFYFVMASNKDFSSSTAYSAPYPYSRNNEWSDKSTPKAQSWNRRELEYKITDITKVGDNITFNTSGTNDTNYKITVSPEDPKAEAIVGYTYQLVASVSPEPASQEVTWSSSNTNLATINSDGLVKFLKEGSVTMTATSVESPDSKGKIILSPIAPGVKISQEDPEAVAYYKETLQLNATISPSDFDQSIEWSTSDNSLATVSNEGLVEFLGVDEVTITATSTELPEYNASLTFQPVIFQGLLGHVTDSDNNPVAGLELNIYPIHKVSQNINGTRTEVYARVEGAEPFVITTNEVGFYRAGLPEGDYEIEASSLQYVDLFSRVEIVEGSTSMDMCMENYIEEISKYYSHTDVTTANNFFEAETNSYTALTKWERSDLESVVGNKITRIKAMIGCSSTVVFKIYEGSTTSEPIYKSDAISVETDYARNIVANIAVDDQITIRKGRDYYIGYEVSNYDYNTPSAISDALSTSGNGDYIIYNGSLTTLSKILGEPSGDWLIGFYTQDDSQIISLNITEGQTDAKMTWNPGVYKYFKITYCDSSMINSPEVVIEDSEYTFESLESSTTYNVTVKASENGSTYVNLFNASFTTVSKKTLIPMILLDYEYSVGTVLELKAINLTNNDTIDWYFDGEQVSRGKVELKAGEHIVKSIVNRSGKEYITVKIINVK